jgi:octaprenyl-diphosphate synthase
MGKLRELHEARKLNQALASKDIFELVRDDLQRVDAEIGRHLASSASAVNSIGRYLHSSGGKRLRPALLLMSSKLMGDGGDRAIRLAAVVEMIHTATLVHDDVIDVAQTRRGQPSPNVLWGNHTSVLAGDWLYMQAFQIALREGSFPILDMLISLTQTMVEGELLQLERIGSMAVTEAAYMDLVDRKTARLFSSCAKLGAMAAGAREDACSVLGEYAWNLGMAFQCVDDVLDFTATETVLGKPIGSDLREGKVTLPLVYSLEEAGAGERQLVEAVLASRSYDQTPFTRILTLIERHHGVRRAMQRAEAFTQKARDLIATFPDSPYQRALTTMTELVTDRDH